MICPNVKSNQCLENNSNRTSTVTITVNRTIWGYERLEEFCHDFNVKNMICLNIDLSKVKYMSTAAFAYLVKIKKNLRQYGIQLSIQGLQEQPRDLCALLKLSKVLMSNNIDLYENHR